MYHIHLLPASFGDSILIEYGKNPSERSYILIDGGPFFAYDEIMQGIAEVAPEMTHLELLVVTHIDIDHIDGIIKILNQSQEKFTIGEIWFNGWDQIEPNLKPSDMLGGKQGEYLGALIKKKGLPHNETFAGKEVVIDDAMNPKRIKRSDGMVLTLLSPTREALGALGPKWAAVVDGVGDEAAALARLEQDYRYKDEPIDMLGDINVEDLADMWFKGDKSEANGSSIAFLATYDDRTCLFAGDAYTDLLLPPLKALMAPGDQRLKIDAWKMAHHGSKKSTQKKLMELIECDKFLFCSDGKRYKHPDAETVAKVIMTSDLDIDLYFNYRTPFNEIWNESQLQNKYNYRPHYPKDQQKTMTVTL